MKRIISVFCVFLGLNAFAQDRIIMESGDTLSVVVANHNKKNVNYVEYNDPEFKSASLSTQRISRIIFDNGKIIDFHKSKYPGAFIGITLGSAMPFSDFANNSSFNDNRSGYAKGGRPAIGIEGRYPIYKFIGVSAGINMGAFGVDSESYFKQFNDTTSNKSRTTASGTLTNYQYTTLSIGPDLAFKLGSKLRMSIPIEFAFIMMKNKGNDDISYKNSSGNVVGTETKKLDGNGVGFSTGLRMEYMISSKIALGLQAKMYQFSSVVNDVTSTIVTNNVSITNTYTWTQNVSYMHVGATARYYFK